MLCGNTWESVDTRWTNKTNVDITTGKRQPFLCVSLEKCRADLSPEDIIELLVHFRIAAKVFTKE